MREQTKKKIRAMTNDSIWHLLFERLSSIVKNENFMNATSRLTELYWGNNQQTMIWIFILVVVACQALTPILDCRFNPTAKSFNTIHPSGTVLKFIIPDSFDGEKILNAANAKVASDLDEDEEEDDEDV